MEPQDQAVQRHILAASQGGLIDVGQFRGDQATADAG
jgi:hypothetical protein